jgi:hypothetical protein
MSTVRCEDGVVAFRTTILLAGRTATGIQVPEEAVTALNSTKRPRVHATIGGYTYRTTVAPMSGRFMLPISATVRAHAGVGAGDEVDVELVLDTEPREIEVPADFAAALAQEPEAQRLFEGLSYSNRKRHVLSIEGAKTQATRERRIARSLDELREGRT